MNAPRRIADLIGNSSLVAALGRGRLPAAGLFAGPEGIGKRTLALLLAAKSNCRSPLADDLCGDCISCRKAFQGIHPDIRLYTPDAEGGRIRIEQMRELRQEAQYRPFEGRCRCFIVDPADAMTTEAANCILKTLEEPAETTHLLLVTAYPDHLLPTIRSRCLQFSFQPVPRDELEQFLAGPAAAEQSELRAAVARGSVGAALALDVPAYRKERDLALRLLEAWVPKPTFATMLAACEKLGLRVRDRMTAQKYLTLLQDLACDLYLVQSARRERITNVDRQAELKRLARHFDVDRIRRFLDSLALARRDVDRNVKADVCFETVWW